MTGLRYFRDDASQDDMQKAIDARRKSMEAFKKLGNEKKVLDLAYQIQDMIIDSKIILDSKAHSK